MTTPSRDWTMAFLYSRNAFCRALYTLYSIREHLPVIANTSQSKAPSISPRTRRRPAHKSATGFSIASATPRAELIHCTFRRIIRPTGMASHLCLHGGYGAGKEYIWTWLRSARTKGYILVSPKSIAETWTMTMGSRIPGPS